MFYGKALTPTRKSLLLPYNVAMFTRGRIQQLIRVERIVEQIITRSIYTPRYNNTISRDKWKMTDGNDWPERESRVWHLRQRSYNNDRINY